ncbi:MAG: AAA family ATPase, partial [Planctomycetota bacterium]
MKKIYVAATRQHDGKTTVSIGLFSAIRERGLSACFIKPVGQNYLLEDGVKVDEDAVVFKHALSADGDIAMLSPVTIPRGFTEEYIFNRRPDKIRSSICEAFDSVGRNKDVAIIEGTGHAGVGSVIDASNAEVASMLGAHALIVAGGGIGRCIDELALNRALFHEQDVPVAGAVINKVYRDKYKKVSRAVS